MATEVLGGGFGPKLQLHDVTVRAPGQAGRGLRLPTFQLNMSCFRHKIHPKHPLSPLNNIHTPPKQPLHATPIPQKALTLSRNVDEC